MPGIGVSSETVGLTRLLRSTIKALSTLDDTALEELLAKAESVSAKTRKIQIADIEEATALRQTLGELLSSTSRSLGTLEHLRSKKETAWAR